MSNNTIRRQADFHRLFVSGRRYKSRLLTLVIAPRSGRDDCWRAAYIVSRRVSLKAVVRNRVRRRLRAALAGLQAGLEAGHDLAMIVHPAAAEASFAQLQAALQRLLRSAGVLQGDP